MALPNLQKDLLFGKQIEKDFLACFYPWIRRHAGDSPKEPHWKEADFITLDGEFVEFKSERYCLTGEHGKLTKNFFIETLSDQKKRKIGGPSKSVSENVKWYIFFYPCCGEFFLFESEKLHARSQSLIATKKYEAKYIHNSAWTSEGYALPRAEFEDVYIHVNVRSNNANQQTDIHKPEAKSPGRKKR